MKTTSIFTFLLAALTSAAPVPQEAPGCFLPQVIYGNLPYEFTLVAANSGIASIDGKTLKFVPTTAGTFDVGIHTGGAAINTTLVANNLLLGVGTGVKAYIVTPRDKPAFREIEFSSTATPATYEAYPECVGGSPETVIRPSGDDAGQGRGLRPCAPETVADGVIVFCVHPISESTTEYGLWVKGDGSSPSCVEITAVAVH